MSEPRAALEDVLKLLERPLWLVTAATESSRGGLLATWVADVSLHAEPLVMAVSFGMHHFTRELVDSSHAFCLHLISERHSSLAFRFATCSGRDRDKLSDLAWEPARTGSPRIADVVAWLDCRVIARLSTGDRAFYWAEVLDGQRDSHEKPLTDARWMAGLDDRERAHLAARREQDIGRQQPMFQQWRDHLPELLRPPCRDADR